MTLLFVDGFDHYATADLTKKWTSAGSTATIQSAGGRSGGGALRATSTAGEVFKTFPATTSWVIGFRFKASLFELEPLCALLDAGTVQCSLLLNADGTLSVVRGASTAVTSGTSVSALSAGAFAYIEWKVTIADSIGASSCVVKVDGVTVITVATGQDLKATSNTTATQVRMASNGNIGATFDFDDLYICNQSGSTNNDFLGDCRIDTLYPTSDGFYTAWTPASGSDHFAMVDNTTPSLTDYNSTATAGNRDSYGMGNLAALASQTVYGVQVNAALLKDDGGSRTANTMVRSNSTNADGTTVGIGTSQLYVSQVYETNPDGSIAWTETTVNAMEAGVELVA